MTPGRCWRPRTPAPGGICWLSSACRSKSSSPAIDETALPGESPVPYVRRLAVAKAGAVGAADDVLVIAADTTVDLDGRILGKPVDADDAAAMLRSLSGRTHRVHTAVAVRHGVAEAGEVATTMVTMTPIGESAIQWYVVHR